MEAVRQTGNLPIPTHLQDAHYKGAAKLGRGTGYKYAHDYPNHYVAQQYFHGLLIYHRLIGAHALVLVIHGPLDQRFDILNR